MGQYYRAVVIGEDGQASFLDPFDYDNFYKLTEHSYIGNSFVNAVQGMIWKKPNRVAWMGDYSDSYDGDSYEQKMPEDDFKALYDAVWNKKDCKARPDESVEQHEGGHTGQYVVNHARREYIDLDACWNRNKDKYTYKDGDVEFCIHPLPLLTACGNGRGGGDYHNRYPDYDKCGTWAFDLIEVTDEKPEVYMPVMYRFKERTD